MLVRNPIAAGRFYEAAPSACQTHVQELVAVAAADIPLEGTICAGIVPHAGWIFSGPLAALVLKTIAQRQEVDTFVIFGAAHAVASQQGLLFAQGQWHTPLGNVEVDEELAERVLDGAGDFVIADEAGHEREHSIEVQLPLIQAVFPQAKIVPIVVGPFPTAPDIGRAVAQALQGQLKRIVYLASTDLTHYGPSYLFTPQGTGPEALRWAKEVNDVNFLNHVLALKASEALDASRTYQAACGGGAVAAVIEAARECGAQRGYLLEHTTSAEVMQERFSQTSEDSVGYAAVVMG